MLIFFINGSSSLLFLISTCKAFYCSELISWKLSNVFLIVASFLCNATKYKQIFLLLDYFAIYLVSISYINNICINFLYSLLLVYEYKKYNSIENVKNVAFATSLVKSVIYTYFYVDTIHYYIIITSSVFGFVIYKIRGYFHNKNNNNYTLFLTYLFHICIMNIIYISSITAI